MSHTFRNHAVVSSDRSVTVRAPELEPGARVEVIVVMDSSHGATSPGASFIDAVADVTIDAPEDYSVNFEDVLYRSSREA